MDKQNYQQLTRTFLRLSRFSHLAAVAGWDMFAMMPPGGSTARGAALAELSVLQHQLLTDKQVAGWLKGAQQEDLSDMEQANLREMNRHYQQAALLPETLVEAKSLAGSRCEHAWRTQRPANDWQGFAENLRQVVKLSREEAALRADAGTAGASALRLVALTGYGQKDDVARALAAGFDVHLTKPATIEALQGAVVAQFAAPAWASR